MRKGQTGVETLIIIGIIFILILTLYALFIVPKDNQAHEVMLYLSARNVCDRTANAINTASFSGDGFYLNFQIPEKLVGYRNYTLTVYTSGVSVKWNYTNTEETMCHIHVKNVTFTNQSLSTPFTLNSTNYVARNNDGAVMIE
jgi:hypothetical protein